MDGIVANYNQHKSNKFQNANIELEIRHTKITQKLFIIYNNYINKLGNFTRTDTINSICDDVIKTFTYEKGTLKSTESSTKKHIGSYDMGNGFKVNIAQEDKLSYETVSSSNALIRIKTRKSAPIDVDGAKWRLDITIVKQITSFEAKNSKQYSSILFNADYDELANNPKNDITYHYEAELELLSGKLTDPIFRKALHLFKSITNPNSDSDVLVVEYLKYVDGLINKNVENKYKKATLTIKSVLPNVSSLTRNNYRLIYKDMVGYYMTDKAEGIRSILILKDKKCCIVNSDIKIIDSIITEPDIYILDGEYIKDKNLFLAFDAIHSANKPFNERILAVKAAVDVISKYTPCKVKTFYKIEKLEDIKAHYESIMSTKVDYDNDGIIFTSCGKSYTETINYKWKPVEHNTIDFLAKKLPESYIGEGKFAIRDGFDIYLLFVGISKYQLDRYKIQLNNEWYKELFDLSQFTNYIPIHFAVFNSPYAYIYYHPKSFDKPIDGKIIELFADDIDGVIPSWRLVNIREDRDIDLSGGNYFGNNYSVAENVWLNYMDPFPETELWNPSSAYFETNKSLTYISLTKFINHVKEEAIKSLNGSNIIIDIGAGKGQDLDKYNKIKLSTLVAVDKDKSALSELIARKNKLNNSKMTIFTISHDINLNSHDLHQNGFAILEKDLEQKYNISKCNAIVCNLALHYVNKLENFVVFCNNMVKQSGYVLFTCFSGEKVHELFEANNIKNGESWIQYKDGIPKYQLERRYEGDFTGQNCKIGVLLPFSKGELYEENLININDLLKEFSKNNFRQDYCDSISADIKKYSPKNKDFTLDKDDEYYAGLYYKVLLCKL